MIVNYCSYRAERRGTKANKLHKSNDELAVLMGTIQALVDDHSVPDNQKIIKEHRNDSYAKRDKYLDEYGYDNRDIVKLLLGRLEERQYKETIPITGERELEVFKIKMPDKEMYFKFEIKIIKAKGDRTVFSIISFHPDD